MKLSTNESLDIHQPMRVENTDVIFQFTSDTGKVQNSEDDEEIVKDSQNNQEDVECRVSHV